jgi:hypothetical protein
MNQVLSNHGNQLSNRVLLSFLSSFDGGNQRNTWELEVATMEEKE